MKNKTTYDRAMHDKTHPYTLISAELINNEDLTGEERFLLIYLFGRSDDYIFNSSYFANQAQQLFGWGRDKFYKIWISLQDKGYISKEKIRAKGKIDGHHYTVHEILPQFLKTQNTENPESGKSKIRRTSALPSIDKPNIDELNIDKPISTKTNHSGDVVSKHDKKKSVKKRSFKKVKVNEVFEYVCKLNPSEHSRKWIINDKDYKLIEKAIDLFGLEEAKNYAEECVKSSSKEYCSVSYIFTDIRKRGSLLSFLKKTPSALSAVVGADFSEKNVEDALYESSEYHLFNFIKNTISEYHKAASSWKESDSDIDNCYLLMDYGDRINLAEKLQDGLKSAIQKNKWSFNQIIYQAKAAINTYDETYGL